MRTYEERVRLIHSRTVILKKERRKRKQRIIDAVCIAASLLLVICIGTFMSDLTAGIGESSVQSPSGTASILESNAATGYFFIGVLAFWLGVCVTVLLYRLHRAGLRANHKDQENEL